MNLEKRLTQCEKILKAFRDAKLRGNGYLNCLDLGRLYIMQPHARMFELERKGYIFDDRWAEGNSYKEYRLVEEPKQTNIFGN